MLVTDRFLLIHPPKTAGIAVTRFLIDNLPGRKAQHVPAGHQEPGAEWVPGVRHETLPMAREVLGSLDRFEQIVVPIRNPYEMEVSRFHYLRLGNPWDACMQQDLALAGDFTRFARDAPLWFPMSDYFLLDGVQPANLRIVRNESLADDLAGLIAPLPVTHPLERINGTKHPPVDQFVNPENEPYIFDRYRHLFRYYERSFAHPAGVARAP